jgi:hypothetical protein
MLDVVGIDDVANRSEARNQYGKWLVSLDESDEAGDNLGFDYDRR